MRPFCDWLSASSPLESTVAYLDALQPVLDAGGFSYEDIDPDDKRPRLYRCASGGSVRLFPRHGVVVVSASGQAASHLRNQGLWGEYLLALSSRPHRVTTLHATVEVATDAVPLIGRLVRRAHAGKICFCRKAVAPSSVTQILSPGIDGRVTGTLYLGSSQADVRGVVYDKRQERIAKGCADPGPLLRYEMRLKSGCGVTLRDAYDPTAVFFHYASPTLFARPRSVQDWISHAEGFTLPDRTTFTPVELMVRKLESSPDVARLVELAVESGPYGDDVLLGRLRDLLQFARTGTNDRMRRAATKAAGDRPGVPTGPLGVH